MAREIDWTRVVATWRASGRTPSTIAAYAYWARRYVRHCQRRGHDPVARLTRVDVARTTSRGFARRRGCDRAASRQALVATRALACALEALGHATPQWRTPPSPPRLTGIVAAFLAYRVQHRGVARSTRRRDTDVAEAFTRFLATRGRRVEGVRVVDLDAYVEACATRWALKTVARACNSLRAFLRLLFATGRLHRDLARFVALPRLRAVERPPRARPWRDVQRILHAIDTHRAIGRRDFAMFLLMASYGMGAGEVLGLRRTDIDWRARVLHVRRPKTGVAIVLPLLDPVARALAAYLQGARPAHARSRTVFVSQHLPHVALVASGALRHRLASYAAAAGVRGGFLGTHVFRYSYATQQIIGGARIKVVGDILGHRRPASTSVYVRAAIPRLRAVALPVPR